MSEEQNPYMSVRIHSFSKPKGHMVRRYTYQGHRYVLDDGWYKVGRGIAGELELEIQDSGSPVFQCVELDEAEAIDKKEKREKWSASQRAAGDAPEIRRRDHNRRDEILASQRNSQRTRSDAWDDAKFEADFDPAKDGQPVELPNKSSTSTAKSKKGVRTKRRSATK